MLGLVAGVTVIIYMGRWCDAFDHYTSMLEVACTVARVFDARQRNVRRAQ